MNITETLELFKKSFEKVLMSMVEEKVHWESELIDINDEMKAFGAMSFVSFIGERRGRFLIDMDHRMAIAITNLINGENYSSINEQLVRDSISEFNNIVGGEVITIINNTNSFSLRLTPPVVLTGYDIIVSVPGMPSKGAKGSLEIGNCTINIGLEVD